MANREIDTNTIAWLSMPPLMPGDNAPLGAGGLLAKVGISAGVPDFNDPEKGARNAAEFLKSKEGQILERHIKAQLKEQHGITGVTQADMIGILQQEQTAQVDKPKMLRDTTWDYLAKQDEKAKAAATVQVSAPAASQKNDNGVTLGEAVRTYGGVSQTTQNKMKELGL